MASLSGYIFPGTGVDTFLQLIDGYHPPVPLDWEHVTKAIYSVETTLGKNPKGANSSVADRLSKAFRDDGTFKQLQVVYVTLKAGDFSTSGLGVSIPFGFAFTSTSYGVAVCSISKDTVGVPGVTIPAIVDRCMIVSKGTSSLTLMAKFLDGTNIGTTATQEVTVAVLGVEP